MTTVELAAEKGLAIRPAAAAVEVVVVVFRSLML